jgi:hypothetical protein
MLRTTNNIYSKLVPICLVVCEKYIEMQKLTDNDDN